MRCEQIILADEPATISKAGDGKKPGLSGACVQRTGV
jgi:hypothetical protein